MVYDGSEMVTWSKLLADGSSEEVDIDELMKMWKWDNYLALKTGKGIEGA